MPRFHTFYRGHKVGLPKAIKLPCIVKPLTEEASRGISLASVVRDLSFGVGCTNSVTQTIAEWMFKGVKCGGGEDTIVALRPIAPRPTTLPWPVPKTASGNPCGLSRASTAPPGVMRGVPPITTEPSGPTLA